MWHLIIIKSEMTRLPGHWSVGNWWMLCVVSQQQQIIHFLELYCKKIQLFYWRCWKKWWASFIQIIIIKAKKPFPYYSLSCYISNRFCNAVGTSSPRRADGRWFYLLAASHCRVPFRRDIRMYCIRVAILSRDSPKALGPRTVAPNYQHRHLYRN